MTDPIAPPKQWFENPDQYQGDEAIPRELRFERLSLIRCYPNGKTQPGWGGADYVGNQAKGYFNPVRALKFYDKYNSPFAIVMRSIPFLVVDIDGKNGGIEMANMLDLPPTLAETSKSGNGYHLFYEVPESVWNDERGHAEFPDLIGLIPGVDIKGTGIVYHHPHQRWNSMTPVEAPEELLRLIGRAGEAKRVSRLTKEGVSNMDEDDLVILHDQLRDELFETKFVEGRRNTKLFAIGAKMAAAGYPGWDVALYDRGLEIGIDTDEVTDIITNIEKYT